MYLDEYKYVVKEKKKMSNYIVDVMIQIFLLMILIEKILIILMKKILISEMREQV